jgi:23S rRNA pseudouridine1911/1915/1917 synthase
MRLLEDVALRVRVAHGTAGRDAVTHYRVVARGADATRVELRLETGRRGQIRAQLAAIGHPILGDAAYGSRRDPLHRVCLHATHLAFADEDGRLVTFDAPAPQSFLALTASGRGSRVRP